MLRHEALPSIRPSAHSANILECGDGRLLVTWFAGSKEGTEDQIGVGCIYDTSSGQWGKAVIMIRSFEYKGERWVTEQICPIENENGQIIVYTWASPFSSFTLRRHEGAYYWVRSIWRGRPFRFFWDGQNSCNIECLSNCVGLPEEGVVFQGKPLLRDPEAGPVGGWLIPYHTETDNLMNHSRLLFVDGDGLTLKTTDLDLYEPPGCLEPSLARLDKNNYLCYMRYAKKGEGYIWRSESTDGAITFTKPVLTNLRNPHSGIDIAFDNEGNYLLIAYNDSHSLRTPLTLGISDDRGRTFRTQDVETTEGEYSYPKLHQTRDGSWHFFYTYKREHIEHVQFDIKWLLEGRKVIGLR